ncbi:hypothetical protein DH2020_003672 [Rehmannia glutinosa]|uniref:Late embryogenesis abundant protein LEA-2 subgroup domain-containing protein n=1 Tax=Rehmannia glutinosa TaxID=99300 RepID=A0ABR0XMQ7_REHGL
MDKQSRKGHGPHSGFWWLTRGIESSASSGDKKFLTWFKYNEGPTVYSPELWEVLATAGREVNSEEANITRNKYDTQTVYSSCHPFSLHFLTPMFRHREPNPHFLPRHDDPVIEFPSQSQQPPPPPPRSRPPPPHHHGHTSIEPPNAPRPQAPTPPPQPQPKPLPPNPVEVPPNSHHESRPHFTPEHTSQQHGHHRRHHNHPSFLRAPASRRTKPIAWLVAAFCALFWIIIIVGGLIVLIVYLVFQPRNPRFDISSATLNAAYLDMGYLLNADVTLLANFTNPNTKVNVDFNYVVLDLYIDRNSIATRYVAPFSVMKGESRLVDVHLVASQVRLSPGLSLELQRQMDNGRVNLEIRGLFRTRSKLGGVFQYSYWLYAHCEIVVAGPPTGVLIEKRCVTRR